jgi:hypothetical protein
MIADDTDAIRKAMEKLDWHKRVGEADAKIKAQQGHKSVTATPDPKPLLDEPGPPFRGFFVEGLQPPVRSPRDSNFCLDEYEQAWDEWDDATLDSGVTVETASLFMWGKLE